MPHKPHPVSFLQIKRNIILIYLNIFWKFVNYEQIILSSWIESGSLRRK